MRQGPRNVSCPSRVAGQPGPRAENREQGQRRRIGLSPCVLVRVNIGESATFRSKNQVLQSPSPKAAPSRMGEAKQRAPADGFSLGSDPRVRAKVEKCRRRALDRAIGHLSNRVNWAAKGLRSSPKRRHLNRSAGGVQNGVFQHDGRHGVCRTQRSHGPLEELLHERERAGRTGQAG